MAGPGRDVALFFVLACAITWAADAPMALAFASHETPPDYALSLVGLGAFGREEFGWRGFAYPRLRERMGPVVGSLLLGAVWGLWHLGMMFTPEHGPPSPSAVALGMVELALWSVVVAWLFERGGMSMAVALAVHMGGHLDNVNRAPADEVRLRVLRFVVLAVAAGATAVALRRRSLSPA